MTDQTEREALVDIIEQAIFETGTALEAATVAQDRIIAAGFHRTPTPHVVGDLGWFNADANSGDQERVTGSPHVVTTGEDTTRFAFRLSDVPVMIRRAYPWIRDEDMPLAVSRLATVLTPAPAPVDREALETLVVQALDALDRENRARWEAWSDDTNPSTANTPPRNNDNRDRARAVFDAIEGVRP